MQTGQRIRDYVLERKLGAGGMGEVWRAHHQTLRRPVAIKVIHDQGSRTSRIRERFEREAHAMALLDHPHIVPVHDFFMNGSDAFLVMGLVDGGSLAERGPMPCKDALKISAEILDALNFAHQQGVIHRDVKPSNILVDRQGHAYVTDFGIALVAGTERITRLTRSGMAVGTPEYMSPEQIITPDVLDHRTDVYSFGCVLYELLAGRPPFGSRGTGSTEFELMQAHVKQQPAPVRTHNPEVDANTESVIARALAKDRELRFAGCGEMAQALVRRAKQPPSFMHRLFSFDGRLNRQQFWTGVLTFMALFAFAFVVAPDESIQAVVVEWVCLLAGLWAALAVSIKRWRDRDRPVAWLLSALLLVPLAWIAIELGLLEGTPGPNRFGDAP